MSKTTGNTVLISGGSAGIGFEIAKLLSEKGNKIIITGRDQDRLHKAALKLNNVTAVNFDVSRKEGVEDFVKKITTDFPELNVVINNAGRAILYKLTDENINGFEKAEEEMLTNYLSIIRLNEKLLPHLKKQKEAAIVNVSSVVAFVPGQLATYSASKAALHSYTLSLRLELEGSPVKVFELMPPLVNTEFSEIIGGSKGIQPSQVAKEFTEAFEKDEYEIHVGNTAHVYKVFLSSPNEALKLVNGRH
ncbi:short-chain dehydrogenase [Sphingobacteriaceae bacterium]|nr:short-chain dehydrogenase [Sphingobacteriaceae bacterium]